jgi:hypothetical protein
MSLFLSADESLVYGLLLGRDSSRPLPLAELCERTGLKARAIKGIVESLRSEHRLPIGASRGKVHGYYVCRTADELEASARALISQAKRMLQGASRMLGEKRVNEMMGQARLWSI